jgi:signal transduction histidine kinase
MPNFLCPVCRAAVQLDTLTCPLCGVDLALAAALAERQVLASATTSRLPDPASMLVPKFGGFLLMNNYIADDQLQAALQRQTELAAQGKRQTIGQVLLGLGYITREQLDQASIEQVQALQNTMRSIVDQLEQHVTQRTQELQRAMEKLAELNDLKANFVATISHELRTPLTQIKGYQHFLAGGNLGTLNPEQQQTVEALGAGIERLITVVENILRFSAALQGQMTLSLAAVAPGALAEQALQASRPKAARGQIHLRAESPATLPPVNADEEKIRWVLIQLLDNAIKFTPPGGEVTLAIQPQAAHLHFAVRDTGIGIVPERVRELFAPFHQLDNSDTRPYTGAGLGLAIVRRILQAHNAEMDIKSFPGQGSTFAFRLPIAAV